MMSESNWLENLFIEADLNNWCTKPYCTTCGTGEFRSSFWRGAVQQVGLDKKLDYIKIHGSRVAISAFEVTERKKIILSLIDGLKNLPRRFCSSSAFRTLIIDIYPPFLRLGVTINLEQELAGTCAGEHLKLMESHHKRIIEENRKRAEYASEEAAKERREQKRIKREADHKLRVENGKLRSKKRDDLIKILKSLTFVERLEKFASDDSISLESIPINLVPSKKEELEDLSPKVALSLIQIIDNRKKHWGRLRRLLQERASKNRSDDLA